MSIGQKYIIGRKWLAVVATSLCEQLFLLSY